VIPLLFTQTQLWPLDGLEILRDATLMTSSVPRFAGIPEVERTQPQRSTDILVVYHWRHNRPPELFVRSHLKTLPVDPLNQTDLHP